MVIVVGAAARQRAGAASAISETTQELGTALGIAILGSVATAIYRGQITDAVPAGVPDYAAESVRDTLGGATEAAPLTSFKQRSSPPRPRRSQTDFRSRA